MTVIRKKLAVNPGHHHKYVYFVLHKSDVREIRSKSGAELIWGCYFQNVPNKVKEALFQA
jgi:hypothetical protein